MVSAVTSPNAATAKNASATARIAIPSPADITACMDLLPAISITTLNSSPSNRLLLRVHHLETC